MLTYLSSEQRLHHPQKSGLSVPGGPAQTQPLRKMIQQALMPVRTRHAYFAIQFVGRICSEAVIVHGQDWIRIIAPMIDSASSDYFISLNRSSGKHLVPT
jgi:hypothetical protein